MTDTKKIIYICGVGHNGSTFLNLLLDLPTNFLALSQLNDLLIDYIPGHNIGDENELRRDFWTQVLDRCPNDLIVNLPKTNREILSERKFMKFLFSSKARRSYAECNELLLDAIFEQAGCRVIVDASKNNSRCLGLLSSKYDVRAIHLVRDVRGFVNSTNKRRTEKGLRSHYLVPTFRWLVKNCMASLGVKRIAQNYTLLRYEDLINNPEETLQSLGYFLSEDLAACVPAIKGEVELDPDASLGFGGNRVLRLRKKTRFRSDTVERNGIFNSKMYWFFLGWPSRFWGYRF